MEFRRDPGKLVYYVNKSTTNTLYLGSRSLDVGRRLMSPPVVGSPLVVVRLDMNAMLTYVGEIGDAEQEANGIQDVGLAGAIETGDGIESRIEAVDLGSLAVGFEAIDYD